MSVIRVWSIPTKNEYKRPSHHPAIYYIIVLRRLSYLTYRSKHTTCKTHCHSSAACIHVHQSDYHCDSLSSLLLCCSWSRLSIISGVTTLYQRIVFANEINIYSILLTYRILIIPHIYSSFMKTYHYLTDTCGLISLWSHCILPIDRTTWTCHLELMRDNNSTSDMLQAVGSPEYRSPTNYNEGFISPILYSLCFSSATDTLICILWEMMNDCIRMMTITAIIPEHRTITLFPCRFAWPKKV